MAEDTSLSGDVETTDPTPEEERSGDDTQQQEGTLSIEDLRQVIEDVLDSKLPAHLAAHQGQFARRVTALEQLRPQLEALGISTKKLERMTLDMARGLLTEDGQAVLETGLAQLEAESKQERERREKAERDNEALLTAAQANTRQIAWEHIENAMGQFALEEGFTNQDQETFTRLMPKLQKPGPGDRYGFLALADQWKKHLRAEADRRAKVAEQKPIILSERGGGAVGRTLEGYRKALKEGNVEELRKYPPEEIDRLTAAKYKPG